MDHGPAVGLTRRPWSQPVRPVQLLSKAKNVESAEPAGLNQLKMYHMVNIKLFFDYPKRKDGFMGRENRRYWIINTKTNIKIRITEKIFDGIQASKLL